MYNPNPEYARLVKKLMLKIDDRSAVLEQEAGSIHLTQYPHESLTHITP
jgi:hypothetical protein